MLLLSVSILKKIIYFANDVDDDDVLLVVVAGDDNDDDVNLSMCFIFSFNTRCKIK